MRVLIVEDDRQLAAFLARGLSQEGFGTDAVPNGQDGAFRALTGEYDAIVLDLMLPEKDGLAVLREVRDAGLRTPVVVLTAKDTPIDEVRGLDEGADDYITKPFALEVLVARLRAVARRASQSVTARLRVADLALDTHRRQVTRGGREIALSPTEYSLLELFMRHPGLPLSKARIFQSVWGYERETFSNVVEVYVNYLRRKLEAGAQLG